MHTRMKTFYSNVIYRNMRKQWMPEQIAYMKQVFTYDPETGIIDKNDTINKYRVKKYKIIKNVGSVEYKPRINITAPGFKTTHIEKSHLCWLLYYGELPSQHLVIDHIDHDRNNNCICNLRLCTQQQNTMNMSKSAKQRSSNHRGVSWMKSISKWRAYIVKDNKQIWLGCYTNEKDAAIAYNNKAIELFGEFAHLNKVDE